MILPISDAKAVEHFLVGDAFPLVQRLRRSVEALDHRWMRQEVSGIGIIQATTWDKGSHAISHANAAPAFPGGD